MCSDSAGGVPEVLEQFLFEFAFSSNGATMEVSTKGRGAAAKAALAASVEASTIVGLRKQACGIVRALRVLPLHYQHAQKLSRVAWFAASQPDFSHLNAELCA